jgi:hypothetical protein
MVEDWMIEKLMDPRYPPNQVADFWKRCDFDLKNESIRKLEQKILGDISHFGSPQKSIKRFKVFLKIGRVPEADLEEIYRRGERRWGQIVLQTALRGGIPRQECITLFPHGAQIIPWDLRAPIFSTQPNVSVNRCENPIWQKIQLKILEQVDAVMKLEITPKDRVLCTQAQAQLRQAVRMNRTRPWDLVEAWRFFFEHFPHPDRESDIRARFEQWREKMHHIMHDSTWDFYGTNRWAIRLKDGRHIEIPITEEDDFDIPWDPGAISIRDSLIDLWKLIRSAQLIDFDDHVRGKPSDSQYDRIYAELQLEIELVSLSLGQDLPNDIMAWIAFKHIGPPPRRKSIPQVPSTPIMIDSQEPTMSLTAVCPIQGPETHNAGPEDSTLDSATFRLPFSCSIDDFRSTRTVEQRVQMRRRSGRFRFRLKWKEVPQPPEMSILALSDLGLDGLVTCSQLNIPAEVVSPCSSPQGESENRSVLASPPAVSHKEQASADRVPADQVPADQVPADFVPADQVSEVPAVSAPGIPAVTKIRSESPFGSVSRTQSEPLSGDSG